MAEQFFAGVMQGGFTQPDSLINGMGPLPRFPNGGGPQLNGVADGEYNRQSTLLGDIRPYSYGANPDRISTQTQVAHPNKVQLVIPRLFIPSAQCQPGVTQDPVLEHATNDGDFVFSLRMNYDMEGQGGQYCTMPYSTAFRALKLVNLATANYLLWGLQVGSTLGNGAGRNWKKYYQHFCKTSHEPYENGNFTRDAVWNFLQTFMAPYGVQHGSDHQGGMHEGSDYRVVTNPNDYVSAFAIEGKLHKVANLWRASDIEENDDLVLELTYMPPQINSIPFSLCSSIRATRTETAPVPVGWWYLQPVVLKYKTIVREPHIHIGRAQKAVAGFSQNKWGLGMPPWNARACVVGVGLVMTFEPDFVDSDEMLLLESEEWITPGMLPDEPTQLSHPKGTALPPPPNKDDLMPESVREAAEMEVEKKKKAARESEQKAIKRQELPKKTVKEMLNPPKRQKTDIVNV